MTIRPVPEETEQPISIGVVNQVGPKAMKTSTNVRIGSAETAFLSEEATGSEENRGTTS